MTVSQIRVALPDCPAPASQMLEKAYYPGVEAIVEAVIEVVKYSPQRR